MPVTTNQNLETGIDLSTTIHGIHTQGGTNCHTGTNMIRDERTEATGGRTINPFWVTGSTVKPEICIPFPIFFFFFLFLSLSHTRARAHSRTNTHAHTHTHTLFFVILLPLFFGGIGFNRYSKGKITAERNGRGRCIRALSSVLFLQNPPEREALRSRACESRQRERERERVSERGGRREGEKDREWVSAISRHGESDDGMRVRG